ncbi:MAG: fibronectin type III domain-containing protein [Carboxylicivirga sp.]|nr:fibronectin type III domain-containing protein [Carboxylicivirga sp.]MCT4648616.1 fibronectin type III domain-containing protein [Carboxylicivirga sp.]
MKNLIQVSIILFLISAHTSGIAQNFSVHVESTYQHGDYIVPLKPGATKTFEVKVKNSSTKSQTVSVRKYAMGNIEDWMSISTTSMIISAGQTGTFQFTINVPSSASEGYYTLPLSFDARDDDNNVTPFRGNDQNIIVDSSKPNTPTFSHYTTSKYISVSNWYSWDYFSNTYTTNNSTAGIGGIKSYILTLSKSGSSATKTIPALGASSHRFNATPNTAYTLNVAAVDMAGNSKGSSVNVSTPPAKVTGLSFSNVAYTNVKLSWNASAGATSYTVNKRYNDETTTVNSNITSTSFIIPGLNPNETYDFYVIAQNSAGASDVSDKATVTTPVLPIITGNQVMCSGNYNYSIPNLLPGYSISWSSVHTRVSAQGANPCTFKASKMGATTIKATITDSYSTSVALKTKPVWVGKTLPMDYQLKDGFTGMPKWYLCKSDPNGIHAVHVAGEAHIDDWHWSVTGGVITYDNPYADNSRVTIRPFNENSFSIILKAHNACGWSDWADMSLEVRSCGGYYMAMSPNPASETLNIELLEQNADKNATSRSSFSNTPNDPEYYEIQIWSERKGLVKKQKMKGLKNQIDISSLTPGHYFVHLIYNDTVIKKQLIVK